MANQWMETLLGMVDTETLGKLAGQLGESPQAVTKGLEGSAVAMLSSLAGRAGDSGFLTSILGLLNDPAVSGSASSNVAGLLGGGSQLSGLAGQFLQLVFGDKQSAIASAVGQASGLKSSSASSLLSLAAPLIMAFLGKQVGSGGVAGLASALMGQGPSLQAMLPAGLGSLLTAKLPSPGAAVAAASDSGASKWILPLLLAATALIGVWWFTQKPPDTEPVQEAATEMKKAVEAPVNAAWAALGELLGRKLPNGVELNIPKLGVENRLIDFIMDAAKPVDKATWFDFDRLLFDTGRATLQAASQEQLKNVSEILKAFPNTHLRIGGYTDNTGDAKFNLQLSADRAKTVMEELVKLGIAADRLTSEGYGDQHPVAPNDTEEGRQKNRRVSMRVTKK